MQLRGGDKRPTIRDVASVAGVSRGTVSRVLNGGERVSRQARDAVARAIAETGYTANHAARTLALGRSNTVAFLLSEPQHILFEDPTFARLMGGCTRALAEHGMLLTLVTAGTPADRERAVGYVAARHVDGVLLVSSHAVDPVAEELIATGVPTVVCGRFPGLESRISMVGADDLDGGRQMTGHLLDQGACTIAHITGQMDTPGGFGRLEGYKEALAAAGLPVRPELIVHGDYSRESGAEGMRALLERVPDLDGVFVASDLMAAGACAVLREAGRRIPDDVRVGGFDDAGVAEHLDPELTTMRQPFERISREMVRLLLSRIDGEGDASVFLPSTLIRRAST
ncbi:LacI family DNA-binding transcriptional regulator [Kineosporia sp. J2-2]|uniref:LacI family DNA-binding transcriptional regulator n=1 Tax=Kineosporia corallincola TaxID=2835133 RepID=A0ABS5THL3_9ACTN|nr:LacI family DNA-binding transcriptional regulator [Kineosporia corallincola]MBT0769543.1 LacI family DNA-binding transcriptional regulator [Kineosporia corallincola]